jgi:hypothetical protein
MKFSVNNMEIQKIFSEIDTEEKLYSVLMDEDELALFSEISAELEQREFNSKAQKARRLANTIKNAAESGVKKYKSEGFRTVENKSFLKEARQAERERIQEEILGKEGIPSNTNQFINKKIDVITKGDGRGYTPGSGFSSSRVLSSSYKKPTRRKRGSGYDHSLQSAKKALDENKPGIDGGYKSYKNSVIGRIKPLR